uniref:Uncharacterized protein n=1 Tax=Acrobeloides nanus TaxID=290746 RepID=A0A914E754_9BILA
MSYKHKSEEIKKLIVEAKQNGESNQPDSDPARQDGSIQDRGGFHWIPFGAWSSPCRAACAPSSRQKAIPPNIDQSLLFLFGLG